jgi:hypothetical protein
MIDNQGGQRSFNYLADLTGTPRGSFVPNAQSRTVIGGSEGWAGMALSTSFDTS